MTRGQRLSAEQVELRRQNALRNNLAQYLCPSYQERSWTEEELALLGTLPDEAVAAEIGRTAGAVRIMRTGAASPACDRRRRDGRIGRGS